MNKTEIQRPPSVKNAFSDLLNKMYISNVRNRLRQLNEPTENDCKRWIWELIQNAKDSISQDVTRHTVNIKIIVKDDTVVFKHNGSPFTAKAQLGLLYKYSEGKINNSESTGRFGTGFLTTHTLSKIVSIEGDVYKNEADNSQLCGFSATMYRDGLNEFELLEGVKKMNESTVYTKETNNWTTYTYHLKTPQNRKALKLGLKNFISNIAQVMLFCKELNAVELDNNGVITKIIRKQPQELCDGIFLSEFEIKCENNHVRKFIHKYLEKHSEELTTRFKTSRNMRLTAAIEIDSNNNLVENENAPSHFCVLPLVGSERHIMPIYLNSPDFEPDSERERLILSGEDILAEKKVISEGGINRLILKESIELYGSLVAYLSENGYHKLYLLAKGLKRSPDFEKNFNKEWFEDEIILPYREILKKYAIVETGNKNQKLFNGDNTPNIIIPKDNREERRTKIYNLSAELFPNKLPSQKYSGNWAKLAWDDCGLFGIEDLCKYVADKGNADKLPSYDWLNKFLQFVKKTNESLLKKYALVPNSNGDFVSLETGDFVESAGLTEFMLDTLYAFGVDMKPNLLNSNITAISLPVKIDAKRIAESINEQAEIIIKDENLTVEAIIEKLLPLINIIPTEIKKYGKDFIEKQKNIVEFIMVLFADLQIEKTENNDIPGKAWEATHEWLVNLLVYCVSEHKNVDSLPPDIIENKIEWLNDFIAFVSKEIKEGELDNVAIIPNQNGKFCFKKDLSVDDNIPEILKTEQAEKFGLILKDSLLHKSINSVNISNKKSINTVIEMINKLFKRSKDDVDFAIYLIHCVPEKSSRLYDLQNKLLSLVQKYDCETCKSNTVSEIICSNEDLWRKANDVIIRDCQDCIEENETIEGLRNYLSDQSEKTCDNGDAIIFLNDFYEYLNSMKIAIEGKVVPNQNGIFRYLDDLHEDNKIPDELKEVLLLIDYEKDFKNILAEKSLSIHLKNSKTIDDIAKEIDEAINDIYKNRPKVWEDENFKKAIRMLMVDWFPKNKEKGEKCFPHIYKEKEAIEMNVLWSVKERQEVYKAKDTLKNKDAEIVQLKAIITKKDAEIKDLKTKYEKLEELLLAEKGELEQKKQTKELELYKAEALNPNSENVKTLQIEIQRINNQIAPIDDTIIVMQGGNNSISKKQQIDENHEAKKLVKERLESENFIFPNNYSKQYSTIDGVTKGGKEYPLVIKSYKYDKVPFKIGANEWIHLMNDNAMLWVHFGERKLGCIKLYELLKKQSNLSLTFSTENLEAFRFSEEDMQDMVKGKHKGVDVLAKLLHYFKDVHFDFSNLNKERYTTAAETMDNYRFNDRQHEEDINDSDSDIIL
jgi:hypothetical protein